jgi:50S ribosomal subunit-associated GTPase HflX
VKKLVRNLNQRENPEIQSNPAKTSANLSKSELETNWKYGIDLETHLEKTQKQIEGQIANGRNEIEKVRRKRNAAREKVESRNREKVASVLVCCCSLKP